MRHVAEGCLFLSFMVLSTSDGLPDGWLKPIVDLGAAGILAWALYYLVCRHIPALIKSAREEVQALITSNATELEAQREKYHAQIQSLITSSAEQLADQRATYVRELDAQRASFVESIAAIAGSQTEGQRMLHDDFGELRKHCSDVQERLISARKE